jgi:Pyruvate/2-oxoacid:ferredoxin oxidoreductase delta subunit
MALRNIVVIDEDKCNGCGQCVTACAEGAIEIVDGKAKLISEVYCDGLGACLGHCPEDAITVEQREAAEFDHKATEAHLARQQEKGQAAFQCPGIAARQMQPENAAAQGPTAGAASQLGHWPVQLTLLPPNAPCFADSDLSLIADCVPFAMADFHTRVLAGHSVAVGCPKLDDSEQYIEKVAAILKANKLRSLTVVHMEVPCCFGLTHIARQAITRSGVKMAFKDITVDLKGKVIKTETIGG